MCGYTYICVPFVCTRSAIVCICCGPCACDVVCTYVNVCAYVSLQCECASMRVHVCICGAFAHAYMLRGWVCVRFKWACIYSACVLMWCACA